VLRTPVCDLLGIDVPIIGAPFGPWEQVELAAAISGAGALGSVGTALRTTAELRAQWKRLRELTDRPFAINHTVRPFDEEAFAATLAYRPAAISFHLGVPADLIARAHAADILWIQQVMNRGQALEAVSAGADVIVAQGGEAGGNSGWVSTMVLVPQVVDIAGDIPVIAAGGIADGRGVAADATDAVKVVNSQRVMPPFNRPGGPAEPRALTTPLIEQLREHPEWIDAKVMGLRLREALLAGRGHEFLPFTGQSAGLIDDVLPAAEIVARVMAEAEEALSRARGAQ
jgi:enoyl-[acyl-carrier protein] reductase II